MPSQLLSLVLFGEGLLTGLTLTAMLGPVTMTILRYGMQINKAAGVWAAIGTWISDFIFIAVTFWMTASLSEWTERPSVRMWIFIICGLGLIAIGLVMVRSKSTGLTTAPKSFDRSYGKAFVAGFVVNSLSPFSLFFWIGAAIFLHLQSGNPLWYYGGLMLTLALGDFIKALLAPKLTSWLKEKHVHWVQVGAGILIGLGGIILIGFAFFE